MQELAFLPNLSMAVELWWISLTLLIASIGFGIEINRGFSRAVRNIKEKRISQGRNEVRALLSRVKSKEIDAAEKEICELEDYRYSADAPKRKLRDAVQFFFFAPVAFLGSLLIRLGIDNAVIERTASGWEWILFAFGLLSFLVAVGYTYQLTQLMDREGE